MINPGLGASQISAGLGVGRAAGGASFPLWSLSGDHSTQFMAALNALSATQSDTATTFGSLAGTNKWAGGVLAPNGCIYGMPRDSTIVLKLLSSFPVDANFPQSRYVNKF